MNRLVPFITAGATSEVPNQPRINRAGQQLAVFCPLPGPGNIVQDPGPFRRSRVRVVQQASDFLVACGVALVVGTGVLPHDRVVNRLTSGFLPHHRRFTLIGHPERRDVFLCDVMAGHRLTCGPARVPPDFHRIVLDPALARHDLLVLVLSVGDNLAFYGGQDKTGRRGPLIDRGDKRHADSVVVAPAVT